jgi:hypothetical protein
VCAAHKAVAFAHTRLEHDARRTETRPATDGPFAMGIDVDPEVSGLRV